VTDATNPPAPSFLRDEFLPMEACKRRLLGLWAVLGGLTLLLLLYRTIVAKSYLPLNDEVWGWFLPHIVPTLALMIGVLVMDDRRRAAPDADAAGKVKTASGMLFRLAFGLSAIYLGLLLILVVYEIWSRDDMMELTRGMTYFTTAIQGLIAALLGAFYTHK